MHWIAALLKQPMFSFACSCLRAHHCSLLAQLFGIIFVMKQTEELIWLKNKFGVFFQVTLGDIGLLCSKRLCLECV